MSKWTEEEARERDKFYDANIAPELLRIGKLCEENEMSFIASVETSFCETGRTHTLAKEHSFKQLLIHWAAHCNGNVDSLIGAIDKYARKNGHSSVYLQQLGNKNLKYGDNEFAAIAITTPK